MVSVPAVGEAPGFPEDRLCPCNVRSVSWFRVLQAENKLRLLLQMSYNVCLVLQVITLHQDGLSPHFSVEAILTHKKNI